MRKQRQANEEGQSADRREDLGGLPEDRKGCPLKKVQRELAAVIALKAKKSAIEQDEENSDKHVTVTDAEGVPASQAGVMCKLQERDDIGRIELVQKLARENYQFLQTDKKEQEKSEHNLQGSM